MFSSPSGRKGLGVVKGIGNYAIQNGFAHCRLHLSDQGARGQVKPFHELRSVNRRLPVAQVVAGFQFGHFGLHMLVVFEVARFFLRIFGGDVARAKRH